MLPIPEHPIDGPRRKTKLQKVHEVLAGTKDCHVKILSAKLPSLRHREEKTDWCPELRYPQEPWRRAACGGESGTAEVIARMGLNPQELEVSRSLDQLV